MYCHHHSPDVLYVCGEEVGLCQLESESKFKVVCRVVTNTASDVLH